MKDIGGMQIIIFVGAQQLAVERSHLDPAICFFQPPSMHIFLLNCRTYVVSLMIQGSTLQLS